jgi:tRNA(Ile)-lysidine synthase TilS/MesJ
MKRPAAWPARERAAENDGGEKGTYMRLIATGHNGDDRITLFALNAPGGELRSSRQRMIPSGKTTIQKRSSKCWNSMA